jgi:DNA-binding Lrp family transcriptional regulator
MERALIIGGAETPDPVLTRIRELEKDGVVKDVVVLESFPLQIRLSAPRKTIDELNKIPRVGALR